MYIQQYHFKGKGHSGRAVRLRELASDEVESNMTAAARLVSKDAMVIEMKKVEWRNGVKLMISEYTEPCEDPMAPDVKWKKPDPDVLEDLGKYFRAKDVLIMEAIFREYHEVSQTDLEAITGKALPVAG